MNAVSAHMNKCELTGSKKTTEKAMSNFETERQEIPKLDSHLFKRNGTEEMKSVDSLRPTKIVAKGERIRSQRNHIEDISRKN